MSLNDTPSANRIHIGFFGRRNAGKSSLVNAVTAQDLAVVSDRPGTTTDPVQKAMELLPLGPVVMTDTPGFDDDEQELGSKRVLRTKRVLNKTDIAVLVVDGTKGMDDFDTELLALFREKEIPHLVVFNKADRMPSRPAGVLCVSAQTGEGIETLKNRLGALAPKEDGRKLLADLVCADALVVLVTPIDESAPKGRMILPQVQAIRDTLDADAVVHCRQGNAAIGAFDLTWKNAGPCCHRQSGLRAGFQNRAAGDSAHVVFDSHGALQGLSGDCRARRGKAENAEGRRPRPHLRRLHASPAVQRHRHRKAARLAHALHRRAAHL